MSRPIAITSRAATRALLIAIGALVAAHAAVLVLRYGFGHDTLFGLGRFLDLGEEYNLPTWFSSTQLAIAALLLTLIAREQRGERAPFWPAWVVLAVGFWYLSLDEAVRLHEQFGPLMKGIVPRSGVFYYRPLALTIPVALAVPVGFYRFLRSLPSGTRNAFIVAGAIYVGSAVGLEAVESLLAGAGLGGPLRLSLLDLVEEGGEMLGVALFIRAQLRFVERAHLVRAPRYERPTPTARRIPPVGANV